MFLKIKVKLYSLKTLYRDIFCYPRIKLNVTDNLYDKYWEERRPGNKASLSDWQKDRASIILNVIKDYKKITLGDIGCGDGMVLKYLSDKADVSLAIGYDSSEPILDRAKPLGIQTAKLDINNEKDLSTIKKSDFNLLMEVLEHAASAEKVLKTVYEKSQKGVFFSFPNSGYFTYRLRLLFGKFPSQWVVSPGEHLRFWTAADLKWWLNAQDYKNFKIFYYRGVPVMNKLWSSMFAAGFLVYLSKHENN